MKNKTIHIISDSFSLKKNKEFSNLNIINILVRDNNNLSEEILEASKNTDLIILVNLINIFDENIISNIKNLNCNLLYCSENSFEKENKVHKIATLTPHVIQGFKSETNNVLYEAIKEIIK
jgi:hypothetical protein